MAQTLFDKVDPSLGIPSVLYPLPFDPPSEFTPFILSILRSREQVPITDAVLVIIDVQNDFIDPSSGVGSMGKRRAVPGVQYLLKAFRARQRPIIHVRTLHEPDGSDLSRFDRTKKRMYCVTGTFGAEFVEGVKPVLGEYIVTKHRYDAFLNTDLHTILQKLGCTTLVICGISIDCCVQSTALTAFNLDYYVVIPMDAVSASDKLSYYQPLRHIWKSIGKVLLTTNLF